MSFYLVKQKSGLYSPLDESDFESSKGVAVGTVVKCTAPRNYRFLKKMMALFNLGFSSQEEIKSFEVYRKMKVLEAGFYDDIQIVKNDGNGCISYNSYKLPHSLAFDKMDEETFSKVFNAVLDIIASDTQTAPEQLKKEIEGFY